MASKVVEFYSKENNRVEWDTLNQVNVLHLRYRDELMLSQKFYEDNNSKFNSNKKQLEIVLNKYRMERKINKKLEKLCHSLKNDKQQINNLYCETSKEYIQAMINTGKLPQQQENYLLSQYVEASKGYLERKLDFKKIKQSIHMNEQTLSQQDRMVENQGKTPHESDQSADEDEDIREMFNRRRIRFEEKATQVEEKKKVTQETETEFNKLFMVSKGVQAQGNPKKAIETQTEIEIQNEQTQTDPKSLKNQSVQTEMTAVKGEDFEKLKTVYLTKVKKDPTSNRQIEFDNQLVDEEYDSNQLTYNESKKVSLEDINFGSQSNTKFQRSGQKKLSIKKSRASLFSLSKTPSSSQTPDIEETVDSIQEEDREKTYEFDSQNRLRVFLKKIQEYSKLVRIDSRNNKFNLSNFIEVTRESMKQFDQLSDHIKKRIEEYNKEILNLQITIADQGMEIEELKNIQIAKDKQAEILLNNQMKINSFIDELNISLNDDDDLSQNPQQIVNQLIDGQLVRNKSSSSIGTITFRDPFSNHQNVQNMVNELQNQNAKADASKKRASIMLNLVQQKEKDTSLQSSVSPDSFKPKHLSFQRRQSQMISQLHSLAQSPTINMHMSGGGGSQTNIISNFESKAIQEHIKVMKKIKQTIQGQNINIHFNWQEMNLSQRQKECQEDSEVFLIVEQLQQQANKTQPVNQETIAHKNAVIQIRKLLQQMYSDLIKVIKNGYKLNKPLSLLLREYFSQQTVESKTITLSKMRKALEKCLVVPKSYDEVMMFTQLTGICKSSQEFYDQSQYINIYLQILVYLSIENKATNGSPLQVIHSQLKTNSTLIYKYLPSILSAYLPDKVIYDIVMHLLKPYLSEKVITARDNLVDIPEPEEQELSFNEVLTFVLGKCKIHSQSVSRIYDSVFECMTFNDFEEISEEQFMFVQKYLGFTEENKLLENLFSFRETKSKQVMDKQTFIGFCNRYQIIDDFRYKNLIDSKEYDDLTNFDFDITDKLEQIWGQQVLGIKALLYKFQSYKSIHRRLMTVVDSYIGISKKNINYRKFYKARSVLAYKLLKMDIRNEIQEQLIWSLCLPETLLQFSEITKPLVVDTELKFIQRKKRVLKKGVSVVYKNVFRKNLSIEEQKSSIDSEDSSNLSDSSISKVSDSQNELNYKSNKQSITSIINTLQ